MNPRNLINFFLTPTGKFVGFCVLLVAALVATHHFRKSNSEKPLGLGTVALPGQKPQVIQSVERDIAPYNPPPSKPELSPTGISENRRTNKPELPPISLFADVPATNEPKPLSKFYAPYGRLIPCELVVTVDSSIIRTPIIGLVTEDVYHAGRLIIPAGTEVHGIAQVDHVRERIASGSQWTLVWQSGEELTLRGIALDRETDADRKGWGITDGSAGLRGRIIKSDDMAEIKLFAATFLSGAASALTENQQTLLGTLPLPNLQNAPLGGAQSVLGAYAKQISDSIERDGFYVRVPAGKQFYLYVTQTIDRDDATLGGSRAESVETNDFAIMPQPQVASARQQPIQATQP